MSDKSKHRWYQYSLRTLLAVMSLAAFAAALVPWWRHRSRCLDRANHHDKAAFTWGWLHQSIRENDRWRFALGGDYSDEERHRIAKGEELAAAHAELRDAYLAAIYRPWLSLPDERSVVEQEHLELRKHREPPVPTSQARALNTPKDYKD